MVLDPLNTFYSSSEEPFTLPDKPDGWPRVFERYLNAGDLDAVMALYEPEARFVARSRETLTGREQIRNVLAGMIDAKTRLHSRVVKGGHHWQYRSFIHRL